MTGLLAEYQDAAHPEKAYLNDFEDSLEKWVTSTLGDEEKARQYLSKMFQVEVELSPSQEQVRDFLGEQLNDTPGGREQDGLSETEDS